MTDPTTNLDRLRAMCERGFGFSADEFIDLACRVFPATVAALVAERERADTAEAEVKRLREVNADEGHRVRTLQRLKQVADRAAESAEERATGAEQSFRNATEVVITLSARVSAAEAALTRIRELHPQRHHSGCPWCATCNESYPCRTAAAVLDTKETTRPRRYDQCDNTCTTDCGHCKGNGPPDTKETNHD